MGLYQYIGFYYKKMMINYMILIYFVIYNLFYLSFYQSLHQSYSSQIDYENYYLYKFDLKRMGHTPSKQHLQKLKSQRLDLSSLHFYLSKVTTEEDIEIAIKQLLSIMTLKEKIGQLQQISYGDQQVSEQIRARIVEGSVGSFLNTWKLETINKMQSIAMEQSRLKIPLLMGKDVIHGYRTMFPIPLGQAASFDPDMVQKCNRVAAIECSSTGIKWTFTPMVDIARDPRWGRIAEGFGQDPYLSSVMGVAVVKGFQSINLKDETSVAACGKHYVGYGAAEGGKDYNTTPIPQNTLRDIYLPPFQSLCKNDCLTFMSGFNDLNGEPSTANQFTLKQVLRNEWKFKGIVVSDFEAVLELITHGFAENQMQAAKRSFNSGVDMEMVSSTFYDNLQTLLNKKLVKLQDLQEKVSNILRVKFKLNLFKNYLTDPERQKIILSPTHKQISKNLAIKCPVLLQNKNQTLPINTSIPCLAVIGGLADDKNNQIGTNAGDANPEDSITFLTSITGTLTKTKIIYAKGYKDVQSTDKSLFSEAIAAAKQADKIIIFLGESNQMSGQSCSRALINLPGVQEDLVREIAKIGKPIAAVIFAGRPLLIEPILPLVDSVLYTFHLGTMAGPALTQLIVGNISPSGKLPVTFPRAVGQIPIYYNKKNTGKPNDTHEYIQYTCCYLDIDNTPLYCFGYGLSYSSFSYSNFKISKQSIRIDQSITVSASVKNEGKYKAEEIVFLFVRDLVGSYTRPVRQLKGFKRLTLLPGEIKGASFTITTDDLKYWTKDQKYKAEAGKFNVWIGKNCLQGLMGTFQLTNEISVVQQDKKSTIEEVKEKEQQFQYL